MGENRLMYEIKKYLIRYEKELVQSGMSMEQAKNTINRSINEIYQTCLTNVESSIKAYSYYNSMNANEEKSKVNVLVK